MYPMYMRCHLLDNPSFFSCVFAASKKQIRNSPERPSSCYYAVFLFWHFFIFRTGICFKMLNLCRLL